jgi:2-amino-4-hydroxy-6-hydroxymethyldihydropteridine diphosphokinase
MPRAAIGLGSNVGDAAGNVRRGLAELARLGSVVARSALYRSTPWGVRAQAPFVNAAVLLDTELEPRELLAALKGIETRAGRTATYRWGPRVLDLDILTYDDRRVEEPDLCIPHPRLNERAFALVPLAEIDSRFVGARDALPPGERAGVVEERA